MRDEMFKLILGMIVVTYLTRSAFLLGFCRSRLPARLEALLRYIPVGVLAAIVMPGVLAPEGTLAFEPGNPYLWGGVAAGIGALRGWSPLATMLVGVVATGLARFLW